MQKAFEGGIQYRVVVSMVKTAGVQSRSCSRFITDDVLDKGGRMSTYHQTKPLPPPQQGGKARAIDGDQSGRSPETKNPLKFFLACFSQKVGRWFQRP